MKKMVLLVVLVFCFLSFSAYGQSNGTVDNSSEETIKIDTGDGNSYIIIGDSNTFQIPEVNDRSVSERSETPLVIKDNPQAKAFIATSNAVNLEIDGVESFFTQIVIRLNYNGTWDLVWFEQ